jgi:predicted aminopeptidase
MLFEDATITVGETTLQAGLRYFRLWTITLLLGALFGCSTVGYYYQSARGQLDLMCRARDIDKLLKDDKATPAVRERLERVKSMRRFASESLDLPDNDSYKSYAALDRDYVLWNVFAAPEMSIEPHKWCFPIVGCVVYRGYFKKEDAEKYARSLQEQGLETYVAGVPAYSTLGWFDDPVLSTVLNYPDPDLAGLIFHELAHQVAYAKGDSVFNESFAVTVEMEGVERWLNHQGRPGEIEAYRVSRRRNHEVVETILEYRRRLGEVYRSDYDRNWKLARKAEIIAALKDRYRKMISAWPGYHGYGHWFSKNLNNAHFAVIAAYHARVPAFQALLARDGGDLRKFYEDAVRLSREPKAQREAFLDKLSAGAPSSTTDDRRYKEDL